MDKKNLQVVLILRATVFSDRETVMEECRYLKERILDEVSSSEETATVEYTVVEVQTTNNDTQQETTHMWQVLFNNTVSYKGDSQDQAINTFGRLMSGAQREHDAAARITLLQDSKGIQEFHHLCLTTLSQTVP